MTDPAESAKDRVVDLGYAVGWGLIKALPYRLTAAGSGLVRIWRIGAAARGCAASRPTCVGSSRPRPRPSWPR